MLRLVPSFIAVSLLSVCFAAKAAPIVEVKKSQLDLSYTWNFEGLNGPGYIKDAVSTQFLDGDKKLDFVGQYYIQDEGSINTVSFGAAGNSGINNFFLESDITNHFGGVFPPGDTLPNGAETIASFGAANAVASTDWLFSVTGENTYLDVAINDETNGSSIASATLFDITANAVVSVDSLGFSLLSGHEYAFSAVVSNLLLDDASTALRFNFDEKATLVNVPTPAGVLLLLPAFLGLLLTRRHSNVASTI